MAIQGNVRDLDIPLLLSTATFRRGVIEVECPPLGTVMIYFQHGKIITVARNGEFLNNLLEVLDTILSVIKCRNGTFMMESLDDTDVNVPETVSIDANQLLLWISSLIDEINNRSLTISDDTPLKLVPGKAKDVKDDLIAAFLLLTMEYLVKGTTLRELRKSLPIRDDTLEYFISRLMKSGIIAVSEEKSHPSEEGRPAERKEITPLKVFLSTDDPRIRDMVIGVLTDMGYAPELVEEGLPVPDADLYVGDLNGKGFLWAGSLFGPFASRTVLIGSEDLKPARFVYLRKPIDPEKLREAIRRVIGQNM